MCIAVPGIILEIDGEDAQVDFLGNRLTANISLLPEAKVGDCILVHAGFGIRVLPPEEADESIRLRKEYEKLAASDNA